MYVYMLHACMKTQKVYLLLLIPNLRGYHPIYVHVQLLAYMLLYIILAFAYVYKYYVHTFCAHTFLLSAAPPSRPGFNGGVSSPSRGPFSSPTQLSQATLYPISSLNPYQSKWTIRVRVASKPSIREWSNSRGQGKVFNVDLVDESVSTIGG